MKRALTNLVENALHYGEHAIITLQADPVTMCVSASKMTGPAFPTNLELVLEPFVRLDTARRRDTVGFGLGLSIVARVVAAEGGQLTLANRPQGGLCAEIRLPHCRT